MLHIIHINTDMSRYYVIGEHGDVCSFDESSVRLLDKFEKVAGIYDNSIVISVYEAISVGDTFGNYNMVPLVIGGDALWWSLNKIHKYQHSGYQIWGDFEGAEGPEFMNYNPAITLSHGVHALVDDTGRLLYLDALGRDSVVLGDFCTSLGEFCIWFVKTPTVYIFDDRIKYVPDKFYSMPNKSDPIRINTAHVTDVVLKCSLEWQKVRGYAREVSL